MTWRATLIHSQNERPTYNFSLEMIMVNFYNQPVTAARRCAKCSVYLGSQNPGYTCDTCNWLGRLALRQNHR